MRIDLPQNVNFIIDTLYEHGFEAYAVGGCVRDSLLGRTPQDWDITTSAKPAQVKAIFDHTIDTGIQHGTVTVMLEHRGHGFSDRSVSDISMVTVNSFDDYVSDLDMFIREIVMKREGRRPLYLYGHSMGGAIAALYLEKHPEVFTKAVLSSPMIEMLYGNFSHFAVEAILFVASVLNWNDKYLPSQTPYTDEYDFESSCCLSKARYDYIYKCKVEEERYRTNGATYRWCRAGRKASKYIKKHAQEIKIPVLLCQAGKDYLVSNAAEDEFIAKLPQGIKKVYPDSKHEIFNADDDTLEKFYSDILDFWA